MQDIIGLRQWARVLKADKGDTKKPEEESPTGELRLQELPYKAKDLGGILSSKTIEAHLQLTKKYVDKTRELVQNTEYAKLGLDEVVVKTSSDFTNPLFRNASQAWNHAFYWMCISPPEQDTMPTGDLLQAVEKTYGSADKCREEMIKEGSKVFGSGWLWLNRSGDGLAIYITANARSPLPEKEVPLLCIDLWEHAYYLDYEIDRASYLDSSVKQLLNWGFADKNWEQSKS
jgi:Fe-Mn family superoxide dismutase